MDSGNGWHFPVFILISFVLYLVTVRLVLRRRSQRPLTSTVAWVGGVTVVGGMVFAKVGTMFGWPVAIYFGIPALTAWALPPAAFRMRAREIAEYVPLALMTGPAIHVIASVFLGWHEYMPFVRVPSLWD